MQTENIRFRDDLEQPLVTPYDSQIEKLQLELEEIKARKEIYEWLIFNEVSSSSAKDIVRLNLYHSVRNSLEFSTDEKAEFQCLLDDKREYLLPF